MPISTFVPCSGSCSGFTLPPQRPSRAPETRELPPCSRTRRSWEPPFWKKKVGHKIKCVESWMSERSLEVKLPTIWTDEKQSRAEAERRGRLEERSSEKRKNQRKEDADARKGRKVAKHCIYPMICGGSEGRKVGSLKRRVRSQLARWEMKNCMPLWREAHFKVEM